MDKQQVLLAYPVQLVHGAVATASRAPHVRQMIEQVLFTMPGERVMFPDFGVGLERMVFETTGTEVTTHLQAQVSAELRQWLGGVINVRDVRISVDDSSLIVDVLYELLENGDLHQERFER